MDAETALGQVQRWFHRKEYGRVLYTCDCLLQRPELAHIRPELLFWKGNAHDMAGAAWQGEAISCLREGIAIARRSDPIKARLIAALGKIYSKTGDCASFEKLLPEFERLSHEQHPMFRWSGIYVWFNYGVTMDNAFRFEEAEQAYLKALQLATEMDDEMIGPILHNLGGVYLALDRLKEAFTYMERAEELLSDDTSGHKRLSRRAEYHLASGDLISAQQLITTALLHPRIDEMTRADVHYTWALTLNRLGRPDEAQEKAMVALNFAVKAAHYPGLHKINQLLQHLGERVETL